MPFAFRPTFVDLDSCDIYRVLESGRDARGDFAAGYTLRSSGNKINHHGTHNFDERIGGRGIPVVLKRQNLVTADVITMQDSIDMQAQDVIKVTTRDGRVLWQTVVGEPDKRPASTYKVVYTTPTNPPKVT